eukprot:365037-Chlamydomonas_euryale.AAC.4
MNALPSVQTVSQCNSALAPHLSGPDPPPASARHLPAPLQSMPRPDCVRRSPPVPLQSMPRPDCVRRSPSVPPAIYAQT